MEFVSIPEERLAVLIGVKGKVKRDIERRSKTKLKVEGTSVSIDGEGFDAWKARDVVQAIGRGFNPEYAFMLFNQDYVLEVMNLGDFAAEKSWKRLRGRVIGQEGKSRRYLEKATGAFVSVYGKTISLVAWWFGTCSGWHGFLLPEQGQRFHNAHRNQQVRFNLL